MLSCVGIDLNECVVFGLMEFVGKGVCILVVLLCEESECWNVVVVEVV